MTIYAAGVVCWRRGETGLEFALVHREKYQDWGFAKGKQDPGEFLPETAVREVQEEAGFKVRLGRKLAVSSYQLETGETKEVHYWAARVTDKAQRKTKFAPNQEIAKVEWFGPEQALATLSYGHDRELLRQVLELEQRAELETRAVIVLRHATATPRADWKKGEDTRPLLPQGLAEAQRLISLLDAYNPRLLVTSSWRRCESTIRPYAEFKNRKLVERSQLSELGSKIGPKRLHKLLGGIVAEKKSALVCSHRPAIPAILKHFAGLADVALASEIEQTSLKPGEFVVLRLTNAKNPRVVGIEPVAWQLD